MNDSLMSNYMREAISLAKKGAGFANPNPLVGAVIVKDSKIIGRGYHEKFGSLHAERNAINDAVQSSGDADICAGASLFVTLEPCCHHGKQPPCTEAIISHKFAEVYIGSYDPNPLVNGKGIKQLREAGIVVHERVLQDECDKLNPFFFHYVKTKMPYAILKYAMSMNGISIIKKGSKIISNAESHKAVHQTRSAVMAVLASAKTVNSDNCLLTCRLEGNVHQPHRIILDRKLSIKKDCAILNTADVSPIIIMHSRGNKTKRKFLESKNITLVQVPEKHHRIDLQAAMQKLGSLGYDSVLIESSGKLAEAFLEAGLVQKTQVYIAPLFINQKDGNKRINLGAPASIETFGGDICASFGAAQANAAEAETEGACSQA